MCNDKPTKVGNDDRPGDEELVVDAPPVDPEVRAAYAAGDERRRMAQQ